MELINSETIPESAIRPTKRLFLYSIACMIGRTQLLQWQKAIDIFIPLSGKEESTVMHRPKKISSINAGYIPVYLTNLIDFDDTSFGHPGAKVIPPALTLGKVTHFREGPPYIDHSEV
jgi:2-methylcitrate dehydratase PrpD